MQCGGHELVVLGTYASYCKILLSSLHETLWVPDVCYLKSPSRSGASWNSSASFTVTAALRGRSIPVASSLKKSSSDSGLSLRSLANCQRVVQDDDHRFRSTFDFAFANMIGSPSILFMYSLTGAIAAFLQSSLRSDPDSPSVRCVSSSKGKSISNSVSLSIYGITTLNKKRLARQGVEGHVPMSRFAFVVKHWEGGRRTALASDAGWQSRCRSVCLSHPAPISDPYLKAVHPIVCGIQRVSPGKGMKKNRGSHTS